MRNPSTLSTKNMSTVTGILLACGVLPAPVYPGAGLVEAFTREGFRLIRH